MDISRDLLITSFGANGAKLAGFVSNWLHNNGVDLPVATIGKAAELLDAMEDPSFDPADMVFWFRDFKDVLKNLPTELVNNAVEGVKLAIGELLAYVDNLPDIQLNAIYLHELSDRYGDLMEVYNTCENPGPSYEVEQDYYHQLMTEALADLVANNKIEVTQKVVDAYEAIRSRVNTLTKKCSECENHKSDIAADKKLLESLLTDPDNADVPLEDLLRLRGEVDQLTDDDDVDADDNPYMDVDADDNPYMDDDDE